MNETALIEARLLERLDFGGHTRQQLKRSFHDPDGLATKLLQQYTEALAFIKRNLHRVQGSQGFNSPGILEIPEIALQELLVNALVHRDYFTSASVRILVFTDRIDIIRPC